jgi:HD superfamily phosphohydrolase YqeK
MTEEQFQKIKKYTQAVMKQSNDPQHSFDHVERVRIYALKIVELLKIKDVDLKLIQVACYLHDVPICMFHKSPPIKHWLENYAVIKYLPQVLRELDISGEEYAILLNAIRRHTFTIPYRRLNRNGDIYTKIVQDADSLDYFSHEREESFVKNKNKFFSYFIASLFSKKFLSYGRSHLQQYLNYPELSKHDWYQ